MAEESLEPLVTECPECHTRFRVNEGQLEMARGRVRCGACLSVFVATRHLVFGAEKADKVEEDADKTLDELLDELGTKGIDEVKAHASSIEEAEAEEHAHEAEVTPEADASADNAAASVEPAKLVELDAPVGTQDAYESIEVEQSADEPAEDDDETEAIDHEAPDLHPDPDPELEIDTATETTEIEASAEAADTIDASEAQQKHDPAPAEQFDQLLDSFATEDLVEAEYVSALPVKRRWWLLPAILIATLALVAQVFWFQFSEWSTDTRFRPVYSWFCKMTGCELPVMRDLSQIISKNLVVRSHPDIQDALIVDALIINEADFPQPFPTIEMRFYTMGEHLVAGQRYMPGEYLAGDLKGYTVFQPMTPVHISLEIKDPGPDAVNYRMSFK